MFSHPLRADSYELIRVPTKDFANGKTGGTDMRGLAWDAALLARDWGFRLREIIDALIVQPS